MVTNFKKSFLLLITAIFFTQSLILGCSTEVDSEIKKMEEDGTFDSMPKKEVVMLRKEKEKLLKNLDGIKAMRKVPNAVFVVDPKLEHNAVAEAHKLHIPVFGICDTNSDGISSMFICSCIFLKSSTP